MHVIRDYLRKSMSVWTVLLLAGSFAHAMPSYNDVLVVINTNSSASVEIGRYFQQQRQIPEANVCLVGVTDLQHTIDTVITGLMQEDGSMPIPEKQAMLAAIKSHLTAHNLTDKINYIVLTRGIPYFAANDLLGTTEHLTDLYLLYNLSDAATNAVIPDVFSFNKYFYYIASNYNNRADYTFTRKKYGYPIVSRLDGPGTIPVKQLIDNTGHPALDSYKQGIRYLTLTPYHSDVVRTELLSRTNVQVVAPAQARGQDLREVSTNIMFAYHNSVSWSYAASNTVTVLAPYDYDNDGFYPYYADVDAMSYCSPLYQYTHFLPGSVYSGFRSYVAHYNNRIYGGAARVEISNLNSAPLTDYRKFTDGSDFEFRDMACVEYDPVNRRLWCGTGGRPIGKNCADPDIALATHQKYAANYGSGIGVLNAQTGAIMQHFKEGNSPLLNNHITRIVYDPYAQRMWIAHYKGVQYVDLTNNTWHDIPALGNPYAATVYLYVDPYDTDKIYVSYYNVASGDHANASSIVPGAFYNVFAYSKSSGTVTSYPVETRKNLGPVPLIAKTSATNLWVTRGVLLNKYDLVTQTKIKQLDLSAELPENENTNDTTTVTIRYLTQMISSIDTQGRKVLYAAIPCDVVTPSNSVRRNYIMRITLNADGTEAFDAFNTDEMNLVGGGDRSITALKESPTEPGTFHAAVADGQGSYTRLFESADGNGATWTRINTDKNATIGVRDLVVNSNDLYVARSAGNVRYGQGNASDLIARGVCAFGGGLSHNTFLYDPDTTGEPHPPSTYYPVVSVPMPYSANVSSAGGGGDNHTAHIMFMMLDGYGTGESRFGVHRQYPCSGSSGYEGIMLVFEPKCAPFAPRVDDARFSGLIVGGTTLEIPLHSPGLAVAADGFMAATIHGGTVSVTDGAGTPVTPSEIRYEAATRKIIVTGAFGGATYRVTLKCGANGIKNLKGAALTNTRPDEFKDEITMIFGETPVGAPDLSVAAIAWTPMPPVANRLAILSMTITNSGTLSAAAGWADVYFDGTKRGAVSCPVLAPAATFTGTFGFAGSTLTPGDHTVRVVADATATSDELDEANNELEAPQSIAELPPTHWYKLWPSRQAITLRESRISGTATLTNFVALVQLTDESNPLFTQAQADGDDLVFTLADGVTKLAHQIEMFETASGSRKLVAWVRIPELSATADTTIYLYYGKPDVVSQQNASGAWNNYVAVYHLNETNTTAGADNDVLDSAPAANHGEQVNGVTLGVPTGKVGRASLFTAASSTAVVMKNPANFNVTNLTMSLWFRTTGDKGTSWNGAFAGKGQLGNNLDYDLYVRNGKWRLYPRYFVGATTYDDDVISVPLGNGAWHHITVVADITTTTLVVYVDGAVDRTIATGLTPPLDFYTPRVFVIGRAWDNVRWFDGLIDEVRVERVARSADWIKSEYDTQNNPAAFVSFASAESGPPAASEAPWLPGGWLYRQKVLFDRTLVVGAATLTNFPMLVKLTYAGNPLWSRARSDGADIRFTEADGVTPLAHELELYNPATPELLAWVKVPAYSPSADTAAYLYYGKPGAANQQNAAGVWANYAAVYHLGETNTTAGADNDVLDSGPAANHGEQYNNVVLGVPTGRIGRAALFATNLQNYVTMKNPANFAVTNLTLSLWFRTAGDKGTTWKGGLAGKREAADTVNLDYDVYFDNSRWRFYPRFFVGYTYYEQQTPYTPNTANGAWHHIAAVADNTTTTLMVYVDGVINRTIVYGAAPGFTHYTSRSFTVGRSWDARYHDGLIDEVRVDPVARSADWIKSEYNLQVAPDGYTIFGNEARGTVGSFILIL